MAVPLRLLEQTSIRLHGAHADVVEIPVSHSITSLSLDLSTTTKFDLFSQGYNTLKEHLRAPAPFLPDEEDEEGKDGNHSRD
jgi:hypothetical protein